MTNEIGHLDELFLSKVLKAHTAWILLNAYSKMQVRRNALNSICNQKGSIRSKFGKEAHLGSSVG